MLENFKTAEFFDKETYDLLGDQAIKLLDIRLKLTIDTIRKTLGYPMVINDWSIKANGTFQNRCFRTQKSTTGEKEGSHFKGMGVDFDCYRKGVLVPASEVRKRIMSNIAKYPYIRCFETGINWVHIDIMGEEDSYKRTGIDEKHILIYDFRTKKSTAIARNEISSYSE